MDEFYRAVLKYVESRYSAIWNGVVHNPPISLLFSPHSVDLKRTDLAQILKFIKIIDRLKRDQNYIKGISLPPIAQHPIPNSSVFTCYDFHITEAGPKLIEINTNAAFYIWSAMITELQSSRFDVYGSDYVKSIHDMFAAETKSLAAPSIAIMDEAPLKQKAYSEFLAYKSLFESWGWPTKICDAKDLQWNHAELLVEDTPVNFIYNRHTDFYMESAELANLRHAYLADKVVCSPNPHEYGLIADKMRMVDIRKFATNLPLDEKELVLKIIPKCGLIQDLEDKDSKTGRKNYFFKPLRSHGGKAVYDGSSISNKVFSEILERDYLFQEAIPPAQLTTDNGEKWKWDLRVYAYNDKVQLIIARLYAGQMTNTRTPGGGGAVVNLL